MLIEAVGRKPIGLQRVTEVVLAEKPTTVAIKYHTLGKRVGKRFSYWGDIDRLVVFKTPDQRWFTSVEFNDGRSATFPAASSTPYWPGKPVSR